jgi:hypothetical protein
MHACMQVFAHFFSMSNIEQLAGRMRDVKYKALPKEPQYVLMCINVTRTSICVETIDAQFIIYIEHPYNTHIIYI